MVNSSGRIKNGEWRSIVKNEPTYSGLFNISNIRGSQYSHDAINVGEILMNFMNSEEGQVAC